MPTLSQLSNDVESRYAQLLQPIRDLTKNWEVDIAAYLDDYLDELDKLTISFDGGVTTMNFAEAALLIQGSVCIYSKKVEYLYSLVYQVMDLLANKKKLQQQTENQRKDRESILEQTADEEFLSLDDDEPFKEIRPGDKSHINDVSKIAVETLRDKLADMPGPKANRNNADGGDDQASERLFSVNASLSLSTGLIADFMHTSLNLSSHVSRPPTTGTLGDDCHGETLMPAIAEANDYLGDNNDDCDDNCDVFEAGGMQDEANQPATEIATSKETREALRRGTRDKIVSRQSATGSEKEIDFLDPHQPTTDLCRKKGVVWKLPARIKAKNSKKRPRGSTDVRVSIGQYCRQEFTHKSVVSDTEVLKATSYLQFADLFEAERARRQAVIRHRLKVGNMHELEEAGGDDNDDGEVRTEPLGDDDAHDEDNDFQDGGVDVAVSGGHDWVNQLNSLCLTSDLDRFEKSQQHLPPTIDGAAPLSSYEELVAKHAEEYFTAAQQFVQSTELTQRIEEWERKILPRLREEEERPSFDIHQYGSYILDSFGERAVDCVTVLPLPDIVRDKPTYEICRYFSAMLQLANAHNVEIISDDQSMDSVQLRLMSRRRHFEELADFRVPSLL